MQTYKCSTIDTLINQKLRLILHEKYLLFLLILIDGLLESTVNRIHMD